MGSPSAHALLSPSARHRWGACPGSVREEARYPSPPDNAAATDGTRTHALLERCIKFPGFVLANAVGMEVTDEYGTYTVDQARVERVKVALDYIRSLPGAENAIAEQRVYPDGLVGRADMSGTVDVQIPDKDVYHVIDYKDGMAPVSAENNPQLEMYALGVLAGLEKHPKSVQLTVIQPKLAVKGMPIISTWNVSTKGLLAKVPSIIAEAAATEHPEAPLVPGDAQCKYCKAKGACPALASKVMSEVGVMFQAIPAADVATQAANKDAGSMSDVELAQIQQGAPLMRQLLEAVDTEIQRRLEMGQSVPGFKLVRGNGRRAWALPEDEMVKKLAGMGAPKSAIYETKVVSPAKAEKLTWTDKEGVIQTFSDRQLKRMHNEYVVQQPGKPTVAPESDPRPGINMNAAPLFNTIDVKAEDVTPPLPAFLSAPVEALPDWLK